MADTLYVRLAVAEDVSAIRALIDVSVRKLQAGDYSAEQIEGALGTVFGVDSQLIADQTYFVAVAEGVIAGCGGWSKRKTLFGSDHGSGREDSLLDPASENARIRAFFVHPDWARRGIGSMILDACEAAAAGAGFRGFEMGATITGEKLYSVRGYRAVEHVAVPLSNGASLPIIRMVKLRNIENMANSLTAPISGADHREIGTVTVDIVRAGNARVKRVIYPAGFRWSRDMKPIVGSDLCQHAHVGFLAQGRIHIRYADGCTLEFVAPQAMAIEPGHDGWVDNDEPAVVIEFDFERDTIGRLGMPSEHRH